MNRLFRLIGVIRYTRLIMPGRTRMVTDPLPVLRLKGDTVGITSCRWTDSLGHYEIVPPFLKSPLPRKISKEIRTTPFLITIIGARIR